MILSVTLNPSIDKSMYLKHLTIDTVNRAHTNLYHAGSKGLNITRVCTVLGIDSLATGFCGGVTGQMLQKLLREDGAAFELIDNGQNTRINVKLIDEESGFFTDINEPGGPVSPQDMERLFQLIDSRLGPQDILTLGAQRL